MNASNLQESKIVTHHYNASNLNNSNPPPNFLSNQQDQNSFNLSNSNIRASNLPLNPNGNNFYSSQQNPILSSSNQNMPLGVYDPKFMGNNWETAQTQNSQVKITRSCWLGYHRNNYHPSMTQYRISYDEFNAMIDKIEGIASSFKLIQFLYILMVLLAMFSIILFLIGLFIEPGQSVTDEATFDALDNASTGLIVAGILLIIIGGAVLALIIGSTLKRYEFNIRKMLHEENQHNYYSRNIHWLTSAYCSLVEIKCLPVTAQQYYIMMQQTNQLKISKEYLEKIKKEKD